MLLLQGASIYYSNMVGSSGSLTEAQQLVVNEANLDSVKLLHIVGDAPACFGKTVLDESICAYGDADAEEALGAERCAGDVAAERSETGAGVDLLLRRIARSLLLGSVEVKTGILLDDVLEISQDLKRHAPSWLQVMYPSQHMQSPGPAGTLQACVPVSGG